jgi:anthranilate/para-aminobenzoate synthase component I
MHLKVTEDTVEKIPIAGTMPKKNFETIEDEKSFFDRLVEFLQNPKEENELAMVSDEELKMLMKISNG